MINFIKIGLEAIILIYYWLIYYIRNSEERFNIKIIKWIYGIYGIYGKLTTNLKYIRGIRELYISIVYLGKIPSITRGKIKEIPNKVLDHMPNEIYYLH